MSTFNPNIFNAMVIGCVVVGAFMLTAIVAMVMRPGLDKGHDELLEAKWTKKDKLAIGVIIALTIVVTLFVSYKLWECGRTPNESSYFC